MNCDHGYAPPHCKVTGCPSSRPAVRLGDWTAEHLAPKPDKAIDPRDYPPEAREVARRVEALAQRDNASGDMTRGRGFVGVREDGTKAEGASTWEYRPPVYCARDPDPNGRMLDPIEMNGKTLYQPAPPVHVKNAAPGSPKDIRRNVRRLSESAAEREIARREIAAVPIAATDMNPARIARQKVGRRHRRSA